MILELDTSLLNKLDININQLAFLSLVLNRNQANHQDIRNFISRVKNEEIQDLINRNLVVCKETNTMTIYEPTKEFASLIKKQNDTLFDQFYETFPAYIIRPDGTKGYLRSNVNKCRKEYNRIVGNSIAKHEHIMKCLRFEIEEKMMTGKIGYMKTMWKWLTQAEWECYEDRINDNEEETYGTNCL